MADTALKFAADVAAIGDNIDQLRHAAQTNHATVIAQQKEIRRLRRIENVALRVASSRRGFSGVVDVKVLDDLDQALEDRGDV